VRLHSAIENFVGVSGVTHCPFLNISQCDVTENIEGEGRREVIVYNPLGRTRKALVSIL
jgi:hypothetical protein